MRLEASERRARLAAAVALLSAGCWSWEIRQKLVSKFGMSKWTARKYVYLAQKLILKDLELSKEQARRNSIAFYRAIVADPSQETRDRLRAQQQIDKLLGLEAPRTVHVHGTHVVTAKAEVTIKLAEVAKSDDGVREALIALSRKLPQIQ